MYRVNPLKRNVLITPDEVLFHSDQTEMPNEKNILSAIIIAEERFIKRLICKDLYEDFRERKNVVVTTVNITALQTTVDEAGGKPIVTLKAGDILNAIENVTDVWYVNLWNEYLWKICAEAVMFTSMPTRWLQTKPTGEMLNSPQTIGGDGRDSQSGELKDVRWKMDKILQDRIQPLLDSMKLYLCENADEFEKFNCHDDCPEEDCDDQDDVSYKNKGGWIHGIYD